MNKPDDPRLNVDLCPREKDLPRYWLEPLSAAEKEQWQRHIQACPHCRSAYAEWETLFQRMAPPRAQPISGDLAARVLAAIPASDWKKTSPAKAGGQFWMPALKIAALLLAAAGLGWLGLIGFRSFRTPSPELAARAVPSSIPPHPGTAETRETLRHSLDWLQAAQESDGRWDAQAWGAQPQFGIGVSALAILALIHKEPTVFSSPYAETVRHGIDYLIRCMDAEGLMGPAASGATYNQGLATLALLEAQALESHPEWQAAGERAVHWLIRAQHPAGGWGYVAGDQPNASATIWPLQALIRAEALNDPHLRPAVERGLDWLSQSITASGELAYSTVPPANSSPATLTAAGAVCFLLQNQDTPHPAARRLMAALRRLVPGFQKDAQPNYYRQYFIGRAFELASDTESLQRLAAENEQWRATCQVASGPQAGSWNATDPWGGIGGRVYSTALASLALKDD